MTAAIVVPTVADDNEIKVTWKDTLRLESADGNNKLKFGGRIHWQNAFFSDDEFGGNFWKTVISFAVLVFMFQG